MAGQGYATETRDPKRPIYTPSLDSDEELPRISSISLIDRDYRLFVFRKDGRSWVNASCKESLLSEAEIKARAKRPRKEKHTVSYQLDKMSPPRRNAIDDLLDDTNRNDPHGDDWEIVAIDNENPEITKRQGEVVSFSVILGRINPARQTPIQERRKSFAANSTEYAAPKRRESKIYNRSPPRERIIRDRSPTDRIFRETSPRKREEATQSYRRSQPLFEDDPFGSTNLFSPDGKPVDAQGAAPYANAGLPPHIPLDEPIGTKSQAQNQDKDKQEKDSKKNKKTKGGDIDIEAFFSGANDLLGGNLLDHHSDPDFESPVEVENPKRGRKRSDPIWGEKWMMAEKPSKRTSPVEKSKSRPRRPSIHIPKDHGFQPQPIEVIPATSGRRRPISYYATNVSHNGSIATASIHSDVSVLEAEYEEYSSSASSGYEHGVVYHGGYKEADGRYQRATRDHRRGPPSPNQVRYGPVPEQYVRRPKAERFVTEGALQRYYTTAPVTATSTRPPLIMHNSAPRYTPQTPQIHAPMYPRDSGVLLYPSELAHTAVVPTQRRDTIQEHEAQMYIRDERERDREIELLQRERDVARREAELHHEFARRTNVRDNQRTSRYNYEPRSSRRYTDAYHG